MSEFLDNLKDALEEGKFNSDAAKKINKIDKLADGVKNPSEELNKRIDNDKKLSESEAMESQKEYEKKMRELKIEEEKLAIIATVTNMMNSVEIEIDKLKVFIEDIERAYNPNDKENKELYGKIKELKKNFKYKID